MKKILLFLVGAVLIFFVIRGLTVTHYAAIGRQWEQNRKVLVEEWYQKNNPSHDPEGKQPTEEDMRKIRLEADKGLQ